MYTLPDPRIKTPMSDRCRKNMTALYLRLNNKVAAKRLNKEA